MDHRQQKAIERMMKSGVYSMAANNNGEQKECDSCARTTARKQPHIASLVGGCLNLTEPIDVCGSAIIRTFGRKSIS